MPDPGISYAAQNDWHDHYNERLQEATGCRLEFLPAHVCPPRNPQQIWIAGIHESGDRDGHAVVARGAFVIHDPASHYLGGLPLNRVAVGMVVRPMTRAVPVWSPHRGGRMIVQA